jgi:hypothetical protein
MMCPNISKYGNHFQRLSGDKAAPFRSPTSRPPPYHLAVGKVTDYYFSIITANQRR